MAIARLRTNSEETGFMSKDLKNRTKKFAIRVIRMTKAIKSDKIDDMLIKQVVRSATSIGTNYRSALRGRSTADFT